MKTTRGVSSKRIVRRATKKVHVSRTKPVDAIGPKSRRILEKWATVTRPLYVATDTETTGNDPWGTFEQRGFYPARPFAFSFCDEDGNKAYVRFPVDQMTRRVIPDPDALKLLGRVYANPNLHFVFHNAGFDIRMIELSGMRFNGHFDDTLIMFHIATGGNEKEYGLKPLAKAYADFPDEDQKDLIKSVNDARRKGKKLGWHIAEKEEFGQEPNKADYWLGDPALCRKYAVQDAERTMLLFLIVREKLAENDAFVRVYDREKDLFWVLRDMENTGTRIDMDKVDELKAFYAEYKQKQIELADKNGGKGVNFGSSPQLAQIFYVQKKYPPKYTEKGNYSVNGEALQELADEYEDPLARAVLEFNGAEHVETNFLDVFERKCAPDALNRGGFCLHPNYKQVGARTARMSCVNPNLMNIGSPESANRKADIELRTREPFGPRPGYVWYLPDYSQVEVWVFAFLSGSKKMQELLLSGQDFHGTIARWVFGKMYPEYYTDDAVAQYQKANKCSKKEAEDFIHHIRKTHRKRGKTFMFAKLYGAGIGKIARQMGVKRAEAEKFVKYYNAELPDVAKFMEAMIKVASKQGFITNPYGRLYNIDRGHEYKATNYLIQGTAAEVMKDAMIHVARLLRDKWDGCRILLTIHDELIIEVPEHLHSKRLMRDIIRAMQGDAHKVLGLPRPLPVGMKYAKRTWNNPIELDDNLNRKAA